MKFFESYFFALMMTLVLWSLNFDDTLMMNVPGFDDCMKRRPNGCFLSGIFSNFFDLLHWQQEEDKFMKKKEKRNVCFMLIKFLVVYYFYNNLLLAGYGVDDPLPPSSE